MNRLSDVSYWDGVHRRKPDAGRPKRSRLERIIGPKLYAMTHGFNEHLLMDVYLPRLMGAGAGKRVLEIGSAPGYFLVELHRRLGCDVRGVEYSPVGAALNRELFAQAGLEPHCVMESDVFSPGFQRQQAGKFDVVISRGFIEHFTDTGCVLDAHMALLRPGGLLIITIPNLRGVNYGLARFFHTEVLAIHNLEIMAPGPFRRLFDRPDVEALFCAPVGVFNFGLFNARLPGRKRILSVCVNLQKALNLVFYLLLRPGWCESRFLSPLFMFAGRKRDVTA